MSRPANQLRHQVAHRPWPIPKDPWIMFQSWRRLLFLHWPVDIAKLRSLVPEPLEVEAYNGTGWVSVAPFELCGLRARGLPPLPGASRFLELNFRTYVSFEGKPGVYFFSLDAANQLAVWGARCSYRLPYHLARMRLQEHDGWLHYRSRRHRADAEFNVEYRPIGERYTAAAGTLQHFLTERYALYSVSQQCLLRGEIHHASWQLQPAEARIEYNTLLPSYGISNAEEPIAQYSERQDTLFWLPRRTRLVKGS